MSFFTLVLRRKDIRLSLNQDFDSVRESLSTFQTRSTEDLEMDRTSLCILESGVELVFQSRRLSSVFLYLEPSGEAIGAFSGELDFLDFEFFADPTPSLFELKISEAGFEKSSKDFPNSLDYLNANLRVRLELRESGSLILIDDGSFIR